ncbi:MAG: hypothetical protein COW00_14340 [Bdellovibrio sp. CG12_big_fil_rev_8_21_14_0_65_39_13]|nr:MAG: hypothetical protein COW00_14340 [Bdellovibrio sp. CG12_big_fil_rev_8_21_14_0_65_39_13]
MLMGKVGFPLKLKFSLVIFVLLLSSVGFYVYFAIDIFRKDKSADIYNNSLTSANHLSNQVNSFLIQNKRNLYAIAKSIELGADQTFLKTYFAQEPQLYELKIYSREGKNWKLIQNVVDQSFLDLYKFEDQKSNTEDNEGRDLQDHFQLKFEDRKGLVPGWALSLISESKKIGVIAKIKTDFMRQMISTSAHVFQSKIVDTSGLPLIELQNAEKENINSEGITKVISDGAQQTVTKIGDNLIAFVKLKDFPLYILSSISESKAFSAANVLQQKSLYFGLLIFSVVVIVALLFARALTKNIQLLTSATEKVAQGQFDTQLSIRSNDEIGKLAHSFEFMGKEILRYIEEMKEKSRLENEVKVAQLVQQTYFPEESETLDNVETTYQYVSASECGGDWWGYFKQGDYFYFMICDATGHGVPAALLTATASSALATMKRMNQADNELILPHEMLNVFNQVVAELEGEVNLTALAGVLQLSSGRLICSNASHHPLWVIRNKKTATFKERIEPLLGEVGLRIGQDRNAKYNDSELVLNDGDQLLLLTDGLLELENNEAKAFGQRRLIKELETSDSLSIDLKLKTLLQSAMNFADNKNNDDITISIVKWNQSQRGLGSQTSKAQVLCSKTLKSINLIPTPDSSFEVHFGDLLDQSKSYASVIMAAEEVTAYPQLVSAKAVVCSTQENLENIKLLSEHEIYHLIGENSPFLQEELELSVLGSKGDLIDLMRSKSTISSLNINSGDEKSAKIENFLKQHDFSEYFDSPANYLHFMALELVNNIIMHGESSSVVLSFIKNKNYVAIQVKDQLGLLERKKIIDSIYRGYKDQAPKESGRGAGLGLYLTYSQTNQFWIQRTPNVSTEIVCLIESNKRYKKYKERITSFHFIERGNA